ncbi:MAG: polyprenyl synthetase family protein, partial [Duncaniella sp.]|nr:polyprenyl synthetase family protein [Duncaniella sp.]
TGEMDQIHNAANHSISEEAYFEIITHKPASLFVACVEMGAYAADADPVKLDIMRRFALLFGQCFQIKDDIFDYFHSDSLGKPTGNDLREGKVTLPLLHAMSVHAHPQCDEMSQLLLKGSLSDDEIARLIRYAIEAGGIDYAESTLLRLRDKAAETLAELGPDADTEPLLTLLDYIIARDK